MNDEEALAETERDEATAAHIQRGVVGGRLKFTRSEAKL